MFIQHNFLNEGLELLPELKMSSENNEWDSQLCCNNCHCQYICQSGNLAGGKFPHCIPHTFLGIRKFIRPGLMGNGPHRWKNNYGNCLQQCWAKLKVVHHDNTEKFANQLEGYLEMFLTAAYFITRHFVILSFYRRLWSLAPSSIYQNRLVNVLFISSYHTSNFSDSDIFCCCCYCHGISLAGPT